MKSKKFSFFIFIIYFFSSNISHADLQKELINKITSTQTLSFNFKQKISEKEEIGNCFIKYPLLMKCNYQNKKQKIIISNGKKISIIKMKYKKIYSYPIKSTPLFFILNKKSILKLIRESKPDLIDSNLISFQFVGKKNNLKIFFDKKNLNFKGWETVDAYSNHVSFIITNLKINDPIDDNFFKIPLEEDL